MAGEFTAAGEKMLQALRAGLYQAGLDIMHHSQHLVPVDTGTLKGSGRVMEPERVGNKMVCVVGYGYGEQINPVTGERAVQYAIPVHERTEVFHAPPTSAKFLEIAAIEYEPKMEGTLAIWMTRAAKGETGMTFSLEQIVPSAAASEGI